MGEHERGQVDTSAAEVYDTHFVPALFGRFSERFADAAGVAAGDAVVDVACGTGALTRELRARTAGRVVGADINPAMLAVAGRRGGEIEYLKADAGKLPLDDDAFDLATCQFGLMFFPDPAVGVREMARVALRGAVAVWDSIERSSGYVAMQALFRDELGDAAATSLDAPFAMGAAGALEAIFAEAGIGGVEYESIAGTGRFDTIADWVRTEVRGWTLGESISDARLDALVRAAEGRLAEFAGADGCVFGMGMRVARRAR